MSHFKMKQPIVYAVLVVLASYCTSALALPYALSELPNTHAASPLITPAVASYDTLTDTFSGNSHLSEDDPGAIFSVADGLIANDIVGSFVLDAKVDDTGKLEGGTFALIGKSDTLGIAPGTALITATLTDILYVSSNVTFQVRARVDFVSPALAAEIGIAKSLFMSYSVGPGGAFDANPWNASFLESGYTTGPDVFLLESALPLTPRESLTKYRLQPSSAPVSSYNHLTDRYEILQNSSSASPFFLQQFDPFAFLVSDFTSTLQLSAEVTENGAIDGIGEFSWKGKSSSLSIPEGSVLLSGTPVEAYYLSSGQVIQFLIMIEHIHPNLEDLIGKIDSLLLYDYQAVGPAFDVNPWEASFVDQAYTSGPDMFMTDETLMPSDTDGDGIATAADNCQFVSNGDQRDADADGIGSLCDSDFNNDCVVNFLDLTYFREFFLSSDANADMNGDGSVNFLDAAFITQQFFSNYALNNPSSVSNVCD